MPQRRRHVATGLAAALLAAAPLAGAAFAQSRQGGGGAAPVETGPPNRPEARPASEGQTRAPAVRTQTPLEVAELATGLANPWALAVLPDGRMLVTERSAGVMRVVPAGGGTPSRPVEGTPRADTRRQGGMLDVALGPDFARDGMVYWSYAEPREGGSGTAVARGRLVGWDGERPRVEGAEVIFRMRPTMDSPMHYGSRLVFAPDGKLFVTLGERSVVPGRVQARDLGSHNGKIVRINPDGSVPEDNPFVGRAGALPEIWSIGHRNIQAAALDPEGRLWEVEMGPQGGDELNRPERGRDYGWPDATYGEEYSGAPISGGRTRLEGTEQPVYYWDPVISPSGMVFYTGDLVPEWRGDAFVGGLSARALVRLVVEDGRVVGEERLLADRRERIREVVQAPDGALLLLTDAGDGKLLRVAPRRG